ncbi:MAG: response regulator [Desulfamplus sp.]|nr:response regulator [Desulfamplus sp.]
MALNNFMDLFRNKSLARTLALHIMGLGFLVAFLSASFQLYHAYKHERTEIDKSMEEIHKTMEDMITENLWITSDILLATAMQGILNFPNIESVKITKENGDILMKGRSTSKKKLVHEHEIFKIYRGKNVFLGTIEVTATLDYVFARVLDRSLIIVGSQAILSIFLSLAAMGLFYKLVGRHLYTMSSYAGKISIETLENPLRLERDEKIKESETDEIGRLETAINFMRKRLKSSLDLLKKNEKQFRSLVESTKAIAWELDLETLGFTYMSPRILDLTGFDTDMWTGFEFWKQNIHPEDRESAVNFCLIETEKGKDHEFEYRMIAADGRTIWVKDLVTVLKENRPPLMRGYFFDITEQKKIEKQLQQAQKMESIGSLAGGIAHDFNNLLFPIVGFSEMLLDDFPPGSPEHQNILEIFNAGTRGRELVQQLLSFSRQSEHRPILVYIQKILKEVLKLCRATIPAEITINRDIQADCGGVMADPTQIHQIAMNLITNAFHAVEATGGTITVQLKEVAFSNEDDLKIQLPSGRYALLSVTDTGTGIDPAVMNKIFDPYFTTKKKGKGTGLGLATVYGIVKAHGGGIRVKSEIGEGSCFYVYLPVSEKSETIDIQKQPQTLPTGTEHILLVDDESSIIDMEKQMLERLGYHITGFTDSVDALAALKTDISSFDLVITDMHMPKLTGMQLAEKLIAVRPDLPVILCTGFSERINTENAAASGIKGLLMKPVGMKDLAKKIREVLDDSRS